MKERNRKGFSLIELIVVMAVMAILVLIAAPKYLNYTSEARIKQISSDIKTVSQITSAYMLKNSDELPVGSSNIEIATLNGCITENRVYSSKGVVTSIDEGGLYSILPNTFIKRETGSKLTGQFVSSAGGDIYYISPTAGSAPVVEKTQSAPVIALTESANPDQMLATITYPANSIVQEYKIGDGTWQTATIKTGKSDNSLILSISATGTGLISEVVVPYNITIFARVGYKDSTVKEAKADLTNPAPVFDVINSSDFATINISFPVDAIIKEYRIGTDLWVVYTGPVVMMENGTVSARGKSANGNIIAYSQQDIAGINLSVLPTIASGYGHSLVIDDIGDLWSWGGNNYGQLGDGSNTNRTSLVNVSNRVDQVVAGDSHTLFIKDDATLWACGRNNFGQLGDGTTIDKSTPIKIMDNVKQITAGANHSLAIKEDGSLWAWGWNAGGQLGDGTGINKSIPVKIIDGVKQVAAGGSHTLIIKEDNSFWVCGSNYYGQLGNGMQADVKIPIKVMENVKQINAGTNHSLAIKEDGSLWTWGMNNQGQLGDGTTIDKWRPVKITDDVKQIAGGDGYTLAIKEDKSLWTWGYNQYGQLGDGTTINRKSPIKIMDNVKIISAGFVYAIAIKTDNSLWEWGYNGHRAADYTPVIKVLLPK